MGVAELHFLVCLSSCTPSISWPRCTDNSTATTSSRHKRRLPKPFVSMLLLLRVVWQRAHIKVVVLGMVVVLLLLLLNLLLHVLLQVLLLMLLVPLVVAVVLLLLEVLLLLLLLLLLQLLQLLLLLLLLWKQKGLLVLWRVLELLQRDCCSNPSPYLGRCTIGAGRNIRSSASVQVVSQFCRRSGHTR